MANVFKNSVTGSIGTAGMIVYTAPTATTSTIIGLNIANTNSNNITVVVNGSTIDPTEFTATTGTSIR